MKIRTLIIDDEPIALEKLKSYVNRVPFLELVGECESGLEALQLLSETQVDAIFTDINMPDVNGMEFVSCLSTQPIIVFITAYTQYAVDSYKLSATDYLLKPYSFVEFQRAANKVLEVYNSRHQGQQQETAPAESIFVKVDYRFVRVALSDIRYIKGYGEYLQIYLVGSVNPLLTLSSFANIMERLNSNFLQVHRSYIVNMNQIHHIERARIVIDDNTYIPIGDSFKNRVSQYLQLHSIGNPLKRGS